MLHLQKLFIGQKNGKKRSHRVNLTPALLFQQLVNLSSKDALHLACAVSIQADFFLTCDDSLRKQAQKLELAIAIINPIDYIRNNETYGNK